MIAIIEYNAGNSTSVQHALERIGVESIVTSEHDAILQADKVIFPGVGEASTAMSFLKKRNLDKLIPQLTQPVLGICLGMQLLTQHSEENDTTCLGIFPIKTKAFPTTDIVPHMGWNNFSSCTGRLFQGVSEKDDVYFVHSYYVEQSEYSVATTNYILPFSSALQKDNFYASQFHTEKSGKVGEQILKNFIQL